MAQTFVLPDLGSGLQEAELIVWRVSVGDLVTPRDVLCEVETEKSVIEIPAPYAGVVLALSVAPGGIVNVGDPLAVIGSTSDSLPDLREAGDQAPDPVPSRARESPPVVAGESATSPAARPLATPLVRKLAKGLGLDLRTIVGTGSGGRIVRRDIEAVAHKDDSAGDDRRGQPARETERIPLSRLRRTIATHLSSQWRSVPHVTAHVDADASRLLAARDALAERLQRTVPLDVLLLAASLGALKQFPETNATVEGEELVLHRFYDLGFAVAAPEGLVVPVIRGADRLSIRELCDAVDDLTARGRERRLAPQEQGRQTFTVSNLGSVGPGHATQIVPEGTTAILSFGRATEQAVARQGALVAAPVMAVSATFDHRVIDGAPGLRFLHAIVAVIEEPALLLVRGEP